jgi:hypothetical protein
MVWLIWKHLDLPDPTRRQLAIARYLQDGPQRRMIQAWRGAAKTFLTCAYAIWRLYRNPNERVKIVSANEDKAIENAVFIRRLIEEIPELQFLRPHGAQRDSVLAFDVGPSAAAPTPSVSCVGITGQLTGGRATILISDDVEVPKNSYTETQRERLANLIKEYDALVVPEGFDIIVLGTPQTEQSIYTILQSRGYQCRVWPVRYPSNDEIGKKYAGTLAPDLLDDLKARPELVGRSVEPGRFTEEDLIGRQMSYGKSGFALQFLLDTTLSDAERYPLKVSDLIVMDVDGDVAPVKVSWTSDPERQWKDIPNLGFTGDRAYRPLYVSPEQTPYEKAIMVIDPSGRGKDESGVAVLKVLRGMVYLRRLEGYRDGYSMATLRAIVGLAAEEKVHHVYIESNFGDGMFQALIDPVFNTLYPCTTEEFRASNTQKEIRIVDDLEPVLNQHRLVVDAGLLRKDVELEGGYSFAYQLTHLTKDRGALKHDDRLEVVAAGCRHLRASLVRDTEGAEKDHLEELRKAAIQAALDGNLLSLTNGFSQVSGRPPSRQQGVELHGKQGVRRRGV